MALVVSNIYKDIYGVEPSEDTVVLLKFIYRSFWFHDDKLKNYLNDNYNELKPSN